MADSLKGKIKRFLYDNGDYGVALFISESEPLTITGRISSLEKDKDYEIVGEYVTHPKYGFQFNVESFSQCLPCIRKTSSCFCRIYTLSCNQAFARLLSMRSSFHLALKQA